jgi:hypothetical protein
MDKVQQGLQPGAWCRLLAGTPQRRDSRFAAEGFQVYGISVMEPGGFDESGMTRHKAVVLVPLPCLEGTRKSGVGLVWDVHSSNSAPSICGNFRRHVGQARWLAW